MDFILCEVLFLCEMKSLTTFDAYCLVTILNFISEKVVFIPNRYRL